MTHDLFDSAINTEYMPSQSVPNAKDYFEAWARDSITFREKSAPEVLTYGPGEHETIDIFTPEKPRGTVLFIHGGYWRAFYKDHFSYMAAPLLEQGWRVAIMSYDLAPGVNLAHIVRQAQNATALIAQTFPGPLIVSGHSAGGHLAAMLHATDWAALGLPEVKITAGIGISGLYDLAPLRHTQLQPDLNLSEGDLQNLSPIHQKPVSDSPFIAAVGGLESASFHAQSRQLTDRWPGIASAPVILEGKHHFDAPDELAKLVELALNPTDH